MPSSPRADFQHKVFTVSEITREVQAALEDLLPPFWLVGEVSNLSQPRSGHLYFTLKDSQAQIGAVMWRSAAARLRFRLEDGMKVLVRGALQVYPPQGRYQVMVEKIEPKGIGALQLAFQQLQEKLAREGLFDPRHKKPLPFLPDRIGLITSPTGAAVQDMITVLRRRCPGVSVVLYPVRVQGEGAAAEIAGAIDAMNQRGGFDVLIVGRGGGSLEDLWAFNEEVVARAIFASRIPVISGVGHETDVTIADLVADRRALTPTEAAELSVPERSQLLQRLAQCRSALRAALLARVTEARLRLRSCADSYALRHPIDLVHQKQQRLDELFARAALLMQNRLARSREQWLRLGEVLESLSPLKVLARGYSLTLHEKSRAVVRSASQVQAGELLRTLLQSGEIVSRVERIEAGKTPATGRAPG
ncbi:MAG: exodeoxyribonuclease VII large subunit [Planctomycetes bacterium]|nr:exodeoxyribonuclease VII large subunit [Planctomycetota bacterium]